MIAGIQLAGTNLIINIQSPDLESAQITSITVFSLNQIALSALD